MKGIAYLIVSGAVGPLAWPVLSQVIDPPPQWLTDLSGVAVMAVGLWYLLTKTIPDMRSELTNARREYLESVHVARVAFNETLDKMAERHERWENQRHADSEVLRATLADMSKNCVEVHAIRRRESNT